MRFEVIIWLAASSVGLLLSAWMVVTLLVELQIIRLKGGDRLERLLTVRDLAADSLKVGVFAGFLIAGINGFVQGPRALTLWALVGAAVLLTASVVSSRVTRYRVLQLLRPSGQDGL